MTPGFHSVRPFSEQEVFMCLAIPVKVVEINEDLKAKVDTNGVKLDVITTLVEDLKVGDYVLVHAGHIIEKLDQQEAQERLKLFEELYQKTGHQK